MNPQSWNAYAYVLGNPLNATDPTGSCPMYSYSSADKNGIVTFHDDVGPCPWEQPWLQISNFACIYFAICRTPGQSQSSGGSAGNSGGRGANQPASKNPPKNNSPSKAQQVLNGVFNKPWVLSWIIPIVGAPVVAGIGPAGDLEWDPASHTACAGIGIGASAGHNAAVGPLTNGKTFTGQTYRSGAKDILAGWSLSGGYNTPALIGVQGVINGSGAAWGPSVGVPGVSVASTYSACVTF